MGFSLRELLNMNNKEKKKFSPPPASTASPTLRVGNAQPGRISVAQPQAQQSLSVQPLKPNWQGPMAVGVAPAQNIRVGDNTIIRPSLSASTEPSMSQKPVNWKPSAETGPRISVEDAQVQYNSINQALREGRINNDAYGNALIQIEDNLNGTPLLKSTDIVPSGKSILKDQAVGLGKGLVQAPVRMAHGLAMTPKAIYREVQNKPIDDIQRDVYGTNNSGDIAKSIVGDTAQLALMAVTPGVSTGIKGAVEPTLAARTAAQVGMGYGGKVAVSPTTKLVAPTLTGGALGGPFNVASTMSNDPEASLKDYGVAFGQGTAVGTALGGAGALIGGAKQPIANSLNKVTTGLVNKPSLMANEGGYIQMPGKKQVNDPLYHGSPNADQIRKEGFRTDNKRNAQIYGEGVYLTHSKGRAGEYTSDGTTNTTSFKTLDEVQKSMKDSNNSKVLKTDIPKNAKIYSPDLKNIQKEFFGGDTNYGDPALITKKYKTLGYDGVKIGYGDNAEIVVFNPKTVSIAKPKKSLFKPLGEDGFVKIPGTKDKPIIGSSLSKNKSPVDYSGIEINHPNTKKAIDYLKNNHEKAMADYKANVKKEFGTERVVAGDNAKHIIPGFKDDISNSVHYHEVASRFAKHYYDELLKDPRTKNKPVLVMGGGTGAGKTFTLQDMHGKLGNKYAAIIDTNLATISGAESRIAKALASNRKVQITFVKRDIVGSFRAVLERAMKQKRSITLGTHIDTHVDSSAVLRTLVKKYENNPNVRISILMNRGEGKSITKLPLYSLKKIVYNKDRLKGELRNELEQARKSGQIDEATYKATLIGEKDLAPTGGRTNGRTPSISEPKNPQGQSKKSSFAQNLAKNQEGSIKVPGNKKEPKVTEPTSIKDKPILGEQLTSQVTGKKAKKVSIEDKSLLKSFEKSEAPPEFKDILGAFTERNKTYEKRSNKELWSTAKKRVYDDPVAALDYYYKNNNDDAVATGFALIERYNRKGLTKEAGLLGSDMADRAIQSGRMNQAYALMKKMTPEGIVAHTERQIENFKKDSPKLANKIDFTEATKKDLVNRIKEINKMEDGQARKVKIGQMQEVIDNIFPSSISEKSVTLWKAGLLSSIRTHERNIVGNTMNLAGELTSQAIGSPLDRLMSLRTGKRTNVATFKGLGTGAKQGGVIAKDMLKTGVDTTGDTGAKYNIHHTTWGKGIGGRTAKVLTSAVFRPLGAADKPFRLGRQVNSMYSQGLAEAKNLGLKGQERKDFIDKFVKEVNDTGVTEGETATFANDTALGSAITEGKRALKKRSKAAGTASDVVIPFSQVPSAVATQLVRYSPIGFTKGIYDVGRVLVTKDPTLQRNASLAFGRGATGTMLMGAGALLMVKGLMTGDYPKDEKERALWELEGKQPNSILIDGRWRSFNSIGPQSILTLAGGKATQDFKDGTEAKTATLNSLGYLGSQFRDQTFVKGLTSFTDAFTDPKRKLQGYVEGQVSSVVPNLVKDVAKGTDPYNREVNSIKEKLQTSIPFASKNLTPKRDVLGETLKRDGGLAKSTLDLFNSSPVKGSPTIDEFRKLQDDKFGATPKRIDKKANIGGKSVTFTSKQIGELESTVGPIQRNAIETMMGLDKYRSLPNQDKQNVLQDINKIIEPVENIRVAKKNGLLSDEQFNKAVADLSKAQQEYLKTGTINPVIPDAKKSKEANRDLQDAIQRPVSGGNTSLSLTETNKTIKDKTLSRYSKEVQDFYALTNAEKNAMFKSDPVKAKTLYDQAKKLEGELVSSGVKKAKTTKVKTASKKTSGKKTKVAKGKSGSKAKKGNYNYSTRVLTGLATSTALRNIVQKNKKYTRKRIKS
jgi:hypothetical protein